MNGVLKESRAHGPSPRIQSPRPQHRGQRRRRRYSVERLENRVLLNCVNAAITQAQKTALQTGLGGLVEWAQSLDEHGLVGQVLPVIGQALGQSNDIGQVLLDRFRTPIVNYFTGDPTPTTDELVAFIQNNLGGSANGVTVTVDPGASGGLCDGTELAFTLGYHADRSLMAKPTLGPKGDALGITFDSSVNFSADFDFLFTFGLDLTAGLPVADAFFIRDTSLSAHASGGGSASGGMNLGFFDATMNGSFTLTNAGLTIALNDPDGEVTLNQLTNTPLSTLVLLTPSGSANASVNVTANALGLSATGTLSISSSTPFTPPEVTFSAGLSEVKNFTNVSSGGVIGLLEQLASDYLDLGQTSVLSTALHLAGNRALRNILHLDEVINLELVDGLVNNVTGLISFDSTQSFVTAVEGILGPGTITPLYDQATDELTYTLTIDRNFTAMSQPFGVQFNLSPVVSVTSSSQVSASGAATLNFKLGINLSGVNATLTADADGPANGQLVGGNAVFNLAIGPGATPVAVTVTQASTTGNSNLDDLVADMNTALAAAGLGVPVTAGRTGNRLTLTTRNNFIADLTLTAAAGNPAITELHFVNGANATDNLANHAYIENASATASASVSAPDIDASARLGFLRLDLINGSGSANAGVNFQLKNPITGVPGGRITFPQFVTALQGPIGNLVSGPNISGAVNINLPLKVTGDILGILPGNPNLVVTWTDINNPSTLNLNFNDSQPILNFQNVNASTIINALISLGGYLASLQTSSSLLDKEIPLLNKSISEVISFAEDFAAKAQAYQANPAQALQDLEAFLEDAFNLTDPQLELTLEESNTVVRVDLDLGREFNTTLPMNFALGTFGVSGVGNLLDFQGSANLAVAAGVNLGLDFGIDISQPTTPRPFIYDTTSADLSGRVTGSNINFSAALGPLGLFVRNGVVNVDGDGNAGTTTDRAHVTLDINDLDIDGKIYLSNISLSNASVSVTGQAHATVPIFFPLETTPLDPMTPNLEFAITDLGNIGGTTTLTAPNFAAAFQNFAFLSDLRVVLTGLDFVLQQLEQAIREQALGKRLPIVGEDLDEAADFIANLRTNVVQRLTQRFGAQPDSPTVARQAMFDAFGPGGLGILKDRNSDSQINLSDVGMTLFDLDNDGQADDKVEYDLQLGQNLTLLNAPVDFDIGLPLLALDVNGNAQIQLGWNWHLIAGVQRDVGFYFNTATADELTVNLLARIPDLSARGDLFFLQLDVTDEDADSNPNNNGVDVDMDGVFPSSFGAMLKLNLVDPINPGANQLTFDDIINSSVSQIVQARIDGAADVNLNLLVSFQGDARFPSLASDFNLDWNFVNDSTFRGSTPTIAFNNVRLDVGEFVTDFAEEIARKVRKLTEPLDEVVEFLTTPMPILSEFGINATPVQLAQTFGFISADTAKFIDLAAGLISAINNVPDVDQNLFVPLGSFTVLEDPRETGGLTPVPTQITDPIALLGGMPAAAQELGFFNTLKSIGLGFPLIESPAEAFKILLGNEDVIAFTFDVPDLDFKLPFSYRFGPIFPPFPIFGVIRGSIGAETNLKVGYDMHGLMKFRETDDTLDVFDGFFLFDHDDSGTDVPEAQLNGNIQAGLEINIGFAAAGVTGGIFATLGVDLHDPDNDGRVHVDEFLENLDKNFLCTFDVEGALTAGLTAYVDIGVPPFSIIHKEVTIAEVTLVDFELTDEDCYPDRFSGNNSQGSATDLGVAPGLHVDWLSISGAGEGSGDEDWLKFELLEPDSIDVDIRYSHSRGNLGLAVHNASGMLLGQSDTAEDRDTVRLTNLPAGFYFARITGTAQNEYKFAVEPAPTSTTRVIYVNPSNANPEHPTSYYTHRPGKDINDGLDYTHPKATLQSAYDTYDIGPNDLIVFDTGSHGAAATLTAADQGANYTGTPAGSFISNLVVNDADNNLFYRVGFGGTGIGLHIAGNGKNDAVNNLVRSSVIQNIPTGIRIDSTRYNLIENNSSSGSGTTGIYLSSGAAPVVRSNDIAGRTTGIYTASKVAQVFGNNVHNNTTGVVVEGGVLGPANTPPVESPEDLTRNDIFANATGIYIPPTSTGAVVRFNTVRDNTAAGIEARADNSTIVANLVTGNAVGIVGDDLVGPLSWESNLFNVVRNNTTGMWANAGAEFRFNKVHNNTTGIRADGGTIHHTLVYRNSGRAFSVEAGNGVQITSNTVFAPAGDGVHLKNFSRKVTLRNNIINVQSGYAIRVDPDSEAYSSDYNNLFTSGSGKVAFQSKDVTDLYDWQTEAESDIHSIGRTSLAPTLDDPLFVNTSIDDYHQQTGSTSTDTGDPASPFSLEPAPNGGRINLGAYGNTPGAGTSQTSWIKVESPDFYTDLAVNRFYTINWTAFNVTTGLINIDLYREGFGLVTPIDFAPAGSSGTTTWMPFNFGIVPSNTQRYRVRISSSTNPAVFDESREPFSIPVIGTSFYVDDSSNTNDEYTPAAVGANRNTGTTATQPKSVLRALLLSYPLTASHTVNIDTGNYVHAIDANLRGSSSSSEPRIQTVNGAVFTGPTTGAVALIDRANPFNGATTIHLIGSDDVNLNNLQLTGADTGLHVSDDSDLLEANSLRIFNHAHDGVLIEGNSDQANLVNLTVLANGRHGVFVDSLLTSLTNSEIYDNDGIGAALRNVGGVRVQTNRIHDNLRGIDIINPTFGFGLASVGENGPGLNNLGNVVNNNTTDGIYAAGLVSVNGNTSYGNGTTGIRLSDNASASLNVVRQNQTGIAAFGSSSSIDSNRVYAHPLTGIEASFDSQILRNVVYSNGLYGIHTKNFSGLIDHNIVYSTESASMNIQGPGRGSRVINNTVYEPCDENPPPVEMTNIRFNWDWFIFMQRFQQPASFSSPTWGVARIAFSQPMGVNNPQNTFALGPGGDATALTQQPVPPGDTFRIPIQITDLSLNNVMSGIHVPGIGQVFMQLRQHQPAVGMIEVTLDQFNQTIFGSVNIDVFIDFYLPSQGVTLQQQIPAHLFNSFSGLNPFQSLQTPINLLQQSVPQTFLFDPHDQTSGPWGEFRVFQTFQSPGQPIQPRQDKGDTCAEIGIWVNTNERRVLLRNNIVYVEGSQFLPPPANSHNIVVDNTSTFRWNSDFNLLTTRYGNIGQWAGAEAVDLPAWQGLSNDDRHSRDDDIDLIFVDPDGTDGPMGMGVLGFNGVGLEDGRDDNFHPRSPFGHVTVGAQAPVENLTGTSRPEFLPVVFDPMPFAANLSPAIDNGDPAYAFALEPLSNGKWINMGAYGNTTQASISPGEYLHEVNPIGFEQLVPPAPTRSINITWRAHDPVAAAVDLVLLGGGAPPFTIVAGTPDDGSFIWAIPAGLPAASDYRIRITRSDAAASGRTKYPFSIGTDTIAPKITDTQSIIVEDAWTTNAVTSSVRLNFSENMNGATLAGNYELRGAGANLTFDDGDDILYTLSRTYTPANLTTGVPANVLLTITGGPLPQGLYRLTAFATPGTGLRDIANIALDGDLDGAPGGNYVRTFTIDSTPPAVSSVSGVPSAFRNTPVNTVTFTFSEPVHNFGIADLRLTRNGRYQLLTGTQTLTPSPDFVTWTLSGLTSLTSDEGAYSLEIVAGAEIRDLATNLLAPSTSINWTMDTTAPTADIVNVSPNPRTASVSSMTIVMSEPVSGFDISDLTLTRNGGANLLTGAQTLTSADNITFTLNGLTGLTGNDGIYVLTVNTANIADLATNGLAASAYEAFQVITTAPTATIGAVSPDPRNNAVGSITITMSQLVSGFDISDLSLTRNAGPNLLTGAQTLSTDDNVTFVLANLTSLTGLAGNYLLTLTAAGSGIANAAGTAIAANASESWSVDLTAPTSDIVDVTPDPRSTGVNSITITFSEAVSGFDISDLVLSRSAGPNLLTGTQTLTTSDNITFTLGNLLGLTFPEGSYTLTLSASGSGITDSASNALAGSVSDSFVVNVTTVPTTTLDDSFYVRMLGLDTILIWHNTSTSGPPTYSLNAVTTTNLIFDAGSGNDSLTVDATLGNPIPSLGITYSGGAQTTADSLTVLGGGLSGSYTPSGTTNGSGAVAIGGRTVNFTGLEPVTASDFASFTLITPNAADVLTITSPAAGQNRISGTSGGVPFEALTFFDLASFILDAGANDGGGGNDSLTIDSSGLVASGLTTFRFKGGAGNDTLTVNGGSLAFATDASLDTTNLTLNVNTDATGTANVAFNSTQHLAGLNIGAGGSAVLSSGESKVLVTKSLGITGTGKLDLTNNGMILDYAGSTPIASIQALLTSGYAAGAWNGNGINSSTAAATTGRALGFAESTDLFSTFPATFLGQTVDNTAVLIRYTLYGDADLNGNVNLEDFNRLASNFGQSGRRWSQGNFDYNNVVNLDDFNQLAANFGQSLAGPLPEVQVLPPPPKGRRI